MKLTGSNPLKLSVILFMWLAFAAIYSLALAGNWQHVWQHLNIPNIPDHTIGFEDLWTVPQAVVRVHHGIDPFTTQGLDPANRADLPLDYPRIWIYLYEALHITMDRVVYFGLFLAALYLACITRLMWKAKDFATVLILLLAAFSGSSLLALERGNNDLMIFSLVFAAAESAIFPIFLALLAVAAMFKFYPMAGLMAGVLNKRWLPWIAITMLALFAFFYSERADIAKLALNIPTQYGESYGVKSIGYGLAAYEPASLRPVLSAKVIMSGCLLGTALLAGLSLWGGFRLAGKRPASREIPMLFTVSAAIFVGSYFLLNNYDYRLIFILPTIPFYMERRLDLRWKRWATAAIVLVLLSMNFELFGGHLWHGICTYPDCCYL